MKESSIYKGIIVFLVLLFCAIWATNCHAKPTDDGRRFPGLKYDLAPCPNPLPLPNYPFDAGSQCAWGTHTEYYPIFNALDSLYYYYTGKLVITSLCPNPLPDPNYPWDQYNGCIWNSHNSELYAIFYVIKKLDSVVRTGGGGGGGYDTVLQDGANVTLTRGPGKIISVASSSGGFTAYPPEGYIPFGSTTVDSMSYEKHGNFVYKLYGKATPAFNVAFPGDTSESFINLLGGSNAEVILNAGSINNSFTIEDVAGNPAFNFSNGSIGINSVPYEFPSSQGNPNTFLGNDGSGNLSWTSPGGSSFVAYPPQSYIAYGGEGIDSMSYEKLGNFRYYQYSLFPNFTPFFNVSFPGDTSETTLQLEGNKGDNFHVFNKNGDEVFFSQATKTLLLSPANPDYTLDIVNRPVGSNFIFSNGNIQIGTPSYVFPISQGAASTILQNDGTGTLTWSASVPNKVTIQDASPTGASPMVLSNGAQILILQPLGVSGTLTIGLPTTTVSGQLFEVTTSVNVASVSFTGGTLIVPVSSLSTISPVKLVWDNGSGNWFNQ